MKEKGGREIKNGTSKGEKGWAAVWEERLSFTTMLAHFQTWGENRVSGGRSLFAPGGGEAIFKTARGELRL